MFLTMCLIATRVPYKASNFDVDLESFLLPPPPLQPQLLTNVGEIVVYIVVVATVYVLFSHP